MRIFLLTITLLFSGCAMRSSIDNPIAQATTNVDAVEGDLSSNDGLLDTMRSRNDPIAGDPNWAPIYPKEKADHYAAQTGSLFNTQYINDLYNDSRPREIGDIITVTLNETTSASKNANADLSKTNNATMDPLEVGGQVLQVGDGQYNFSYNLNNNNTFAGAASAQQSNSINGYITVEVVEIRANGNLVIRGEKWMTLNTGDEYIRLSGTIRPDDISIDNTIASNRVSNAKIQYSGTGNNQDTQEPGFLARFFNIAL